VVDGIPRGTTIITGNARLSRQMRREFDAEQQGRGEQLWESPDILPRDAWLRRCWDECVYSAPIDTPVLLDASQELVLWEQVIERSGSAETLLDTPTTAFAAAGAWDLLHSWQLPRTAALFQGVPDAEVFFEWMNAVEAKLKDHHWITASQVPQALTGQIRSGMLRIPGMICHAGFDEIIPSDQRLFETIRESGSVVSELPAVRSFAMSQHFRAAFENTSDELLHAATWARRELDGSPNTQIGIVVRGLASLRTAVERIFDEILHPGVDFSGSDAPRAFHISAGAPIKDLPLVTTALHVLALRRGIPLAEAGMLLRSPFLLLDSGVGASVDAELRREGTHDVSTDTPMIRRHFEPLARAFQMLPDDQQPGQWSATLSRLLKAAGWPGSRTLSHIEHQTMERWNELLSEFARLDSVIQSMEYDEALSRLRKLAAGSPFAPRDEGAPVQIMDMLEASGSRFDSLWIVGLHDRAWPQPLRPNPFLPLALQRSAGAPQSSAERELEYARRLTERLMQSAPTVICSYPTHSGEEKLRISSLIAHLPEIDSIAAVAPTIAEAQYLVAAPLGERTSESAPALPPGTAQSGGMNVIADQAACPFRAFAVHRLSAGGLDVPVLGLSPIERGTIAHRALECFWREIKTQQALQSLSEAERSALILTSVRAAMDRALHHHASAMLPRLQALEENRLQRLLGQWLNLEADRPPFEVAEMETARTVELGGLQLHVKADRVDRYLQGGHAILDYKTSKHLTISGWEGERPDAPQLPLYAAMSDELPISSVMFAKLVAGEPCFVGISEAGEQAGRPPKGPPLAERIQAWRGTMEALATAFRQGHAAVDPKTPKQTCQYCELTPLCRVGERERGLIENEEDVGG
jgi:ATP-dependent helicase/nuclease subunit B